MNEKEQEKQREKSQEKYRSDPLSNMIWAAILIWAGVAFLAINLDLFRSVPFLQDFEGWDLAFAGAGVIVMGEVIIRLTVPAYSGPVVGRLIFALILVSIGLGDRVGWDVIWPVVIIIIGVLMLSSGVLKRSE
jgi:drug/metabolite transporter (DMT)-like permease